MTDWISDKLLHALGWTLVHSIWQLLAIAGVLWLALKVSRKAPSALTYGMGVGALILSFLATLTTFLYLWTRPEGILVLPVDPVNSSPSIDWEVWLAQGIFWTEQNLSLLVNFWFFGVILFLFRLISQFAEIRNLRKTSLPFENLEVQTLTDRLVVNLGMSRKMEIRTTGRAHSPLTFGVMTPVILLPAALIFQLSPAHLEAVIAHELAHVKRNDYLSNLLLSTLEVLFFFHPCYWWMSQTVKELRENAADELALKAGISSTDLANALAEVLQFASQHPPELSLAAGKKRNPTLLRIKRMLGYPTENYPQTPLISIPMVITLLLCAGLVASAPQDPTPIRASFEQNSELSGLVYLQDTTGKSGMDSARTMLVQSNKEMDLTLTLDDGKTYLIKGGKLIHGGDTVLLSPKAITALEKLSSIQMKGEGLPAMAPMPPMPAMAPMFPMDLMAPVPAMPPMAPMPPMPPMPEMPPMAPSTYVGFEVPAFSFKEVEGLYTQVLEGIPFQGDTTKMSKAEKEKWRKEVKEKADNWAQELEMREKESKMREKESEMREKESEMRKKESDMRAKEWEANWKINEVRFKEKMVQFEEKIQKEFEPSLKEFEAKMKEWEKANEPRMKEFESKMKAWEESQGPKLKAFEEKIKQWELANQPRMEEFQKRMEVWQKEQQARIQEFQLLLQEELKKGKN
jgi:beta-lactamase regulating signal transducer with metallopeptidase domain